MNYVTQWLSNDSNFRMGCGFISQPIESNECNAREGRKRGVRIAFPARTCMFTEELKGKRQAGGRRRVDATGCGALPDRPLATTLPSHIHTYAHTHHPSKHLLVVVPFHPSPTAVVHPSAAFEKLLEESGPVVRLHSFLLFLTKSFPLLFIRRRFAPSTIPIPPWHTNVDGTYEQI